MIAIMQPTYLPWIGYFDLIDQVDKFVFLDSVEFSRQSWQQRNRVQTANGLQWLSVPILRKGRSHQLLHEVELNATADFPRSHLRTIEQNYRRAPYFEKYFLELARILEGPPLETHLSILNIKLIEWLVRAFGINTPMVTSSTLECEGKRSELVTEICRACDSKQYLSPPGALDYLKEDQSIFAEKGIAVFIQNYKHPNYSQIYTPFAPYASAIDLLFNAGPKSLEVIRQGRVQPLTLSDALSQSLMS